MLYTKEQIMARVDVRAAAQFLGLAGAAIFLPFVVHVQFITGPIVNAILILTLFLVGARSALVLCMVPSMMALAGGLLPVILAPVVPFIMIGNVMLVLCVDYFANLRQITPNNVKNYWLGVIIGAGLKFSFLFFSVNFISKLLLKQELAIKVAQMMSWPQFATAVAGGVIAWVTLKWLKRM
ncbi:hypothetical protein KKC83_01265 [Patescibacteria group bacterium]|nr:hypothetical protein [Candidatus Falkowbacteria bacterium]MBU3905736.1 hypothetical protein [Patescibacteria group bacterium]MCG2697483.1 hypothetical protein [Candidatus Parcubacteria bacterium]MBU4015804.1 hypothetical protein [Patescibacteria group bacterium]MBU4026158.1 hypothetical protein [Patescibacteria group bacterium]